MSSKGEPHEDSSYSRAYRAITTPTRRDSQHAAAGEEAAGELVWQAAVELARKHGVYSVAHPLRLDYTELKKRVGGA